MILYVIKHKGKGYVDSDDDYGKLRDAAMYTTKAEATLELKDSKEEVVKIEIRVLN